MVNKVLGGGPIDGQLGVNPDWINIEADFNKQLWSIDGQGRLVGWIVETAQAPDGNLLANGLYANPAGVVSDSDVDNEQIESNSEAIKALLIAQGLSGNYGFFASGFTYGEVGDVGIDTDGKIYTYAGSDPLPVTVVAGTDPVGDSNYKRVLFNTNYSSVQEMLLANPLLGSRSSTGATIWERVALSAPTVINDFKPINDIYLNDFGLDPTGASDNKPIVDEATSIVRYLDSMSRDGGLSLKVKGGYYKVSDTFNISLFSSSLVGEPCGLFSRPIFFISGSSNPVMSVIDLTNNNPVNVSGFYSENIEYRGADRQTTPVSVKLGSDNGVGVDIDAKFFNCKFSGAIDLVECWGRGLMIESSEFVQFDRSCISFNWPSGYLPDTNPDQTPEGGFRTNRLLGNRVHAGSGHLILNTSTLNAENLQLHVCDTYIDTFAGLLNGSCINSSFDDNTVINANFVRCFDIDSMIDTDINDTVFTGANGTNTWDTQIFLVCRNSSSVLKGVSVNGGIIKQLKKEVIRLDGDWDDVTIDNVRMKDVTLDNDTQGFALPIVRLFSDGTGLRFTNNKIDIPDMTDKVPLVYLDGRNPANNSGHTIYGNEIPSYCVETDFEPFYASNSMGDFGTYVGNGTDPQTVSLNVTGRAVIVSVKTDIGGNGGDTFMALSGTGVAGPGVLFNGQTLTVSSSYNLNNVEYNYVVVR